MNNPILQWALEILQHPETPTEDTLSQALTLAGVMPDQVKVGAIPLESIFSGIAVEQEQQTPITRRQIPWCDLDAHRIVYPTMDGTPNSFQIPRNLEWTRFQRDDNLALVLLEKYGTYLSVSSDVPHVSFYDVVKSASAIQACLTTGDHNQPFLLVSGDFSGIQDSIYAISSSGALKTLRARSFMLELLTEHIVSELLQATDSQRYCTIFSGGGGFSLLIPNTTENQKAVNSFGKLINNWLLQEMDAQLFLALHGEPLNSDDLKTSYFKQVWEEVAEKLDQQKRCKFFETAGFKTLFQPELPQQLTNQSACQITRRDDLPATQMQNLPGIGQVSELAYHLWYLGDRLTDFDCIVRKPFSTSQTRRNGTLLFPTHESRPDQYQYVIYEVDKLANVKGQSYEALWLINNWNLADYAENTFPFLYGEYVRTVADLPDDVIQIELEEYERDWERRGDPQRMTASFAGLAATAHGAELIGCLRMDVDNSGNLFSEGLSNFSIATISNLSRNLNLFFKGHLNEICRGNIGELAATSPPLNIKAEVNERNVSIVYAGGDDLFIVGVWDDVAELAFDINACFKEFTCQHPNVHISGGLTLHKPKFPLYQMARLSKQAEDAAKSNMKLIKGRKEKVKNSLALFYNDDLKERNIKLNERIEKNNERYVWGQDLDRIEITSEWEELIEVVTLTKQLHQIYEHLPHGFYRKLFETLKTWQEEGLLYMPTMNHIFRRIRSVLANNDIDENTTKFLQTIFKPSLMRKLHIPLLWVEYLNRQGGSQ